MESYILPSTLLATKVDHNDIEELIKVELFFHSYAGVMAITANGRHLKTTNVDGPKVALRRLSQLAEEYIAAGYAIQFQGNIRVVVDSLGKLDIRYHHKFVKYQGPDLVSEIVNKVKSNQSNTNGTKNN